MKNLTAQKIALLESSISKAKTRLNIENLKFAMRAADLPRADHFRLLELVEAHERALRVSL